MERKSPIEGLSDEKTKEESCPCGLLSSLPEEVALNCVAGVSRLDLAALAMASKYHRSLVVSSELGDLRWRMGCVEACMYVCLRIFPDNDLTPGWFILNPAQGRLKPISSNQPYQMAESSSSFVVLDWGIYVIGGILNGEPTSDVWLLDCFDHTWWPIPRMKKARASASASLIDGKIYVFGGLGGEVVNSESWAEVFDPKTRTWELLSVSTQKMPLNIRQSVVLKEEVYAVDDEAQFLSYSPSQGMFWPTGRKDSKPGYRYNLCVIGELLFCSGEPGEILWSKPDELNWELVKGLEEELNRIDFSKLCTNSAGNIVLFWLEQDLEILQLSSAEISLERLLDRDGRCLQICGKIEWSGPVLTLDLESHSYIDVLFADSVYA